ncbi:MAG: histidinol-phosphate transaminase [Coriobacteriia bacterium]|jgi:histidinol-phosphate aminotransferase|nr:histidinol-phosphate transaminase [Coriobacteriia bacterium]
MDWQAAIRAEIEPMVPYAPGLRASEVHERSGRDTILKLSSNEHPAGPFPSAMRSMQAVLPRLNRYPDGSARALRRALCERLSVADENLVVSNGSNELIRLIAQALLRPGDEVVFAWPSFVVYPMVTQMFGATAVKVPLTADEVHDLDAMAAAIRDRTRIVFLCNPNNPTGTIYGTEEFERFLGRVPEDVAVVVDEAYFEFVADGRYPDSLGWFDPAGRIAVLRTFSKIYSLAGLRIGYGVLPAPLACAIDKVREPFNVNTVAQVAAYYSLGDEAEVERRKRENQEQKTYLYSTFDRLGIEYAASETNFVYMKTQRPVEVFEALLGEGVIVRGFGTAPALRVGVGSPDDTPVLIRALEAVAGRIGDI